MGYSFFDFTDDLLVGADEGCGCFFGLIFRLFVTLLFIGMVVAGIGYVVYGVFFAAKWLWGTFGVLIPLGVALVGYIIYRRRQAKRVRDDAAAVATVREMQSRSGLGVIDSNAAPTSPSAAAASASRAENGTDDNLRP